MISEKNRDKRFFYFPRHDWLGKRVRVRNFNVQDHFCGPSCVRFFVDLNVQSKPIFVNLNGLDLKIFDLNTEEVGCTHKDWL